MSTKLGIWRLSKFVDGQQLYFFDGGSHVIRDVTNDCDGDVLWDYMTDNGIIDDWSEYDTDGDNESCAVMHKKLTGPDYRWEFKAYANRPASDDCHTYS